MFRVLVLDEDDKRLQAIKNVSDGGPMLQVAVLFDKRTLGACDFYPAFSKELGEKIIRFIIEAEKCPYALKPEKFVSYYEIPEKENTIGCSVTSIDYSDDEVVINDMQS